MSESNAAREQEVAIRMLDEPMMQADWDIIKARFERVEGKVEKIESRLGAVDTVANQGLRLANSHQPMFERVRAEAVATLLTTEKTSASLDGHTFMTLCRWATYIEQLARPQGRQTVRWLHSKQVTAVVTRDGYEELVAALANAKEFLAHVKVIDS